jgi:hypothetical protein
MLHDLKRDLTLASFAIWLATKNPKEEYCYIDRGHCACGQWLAHLGIDYLCETKFLWSGPLGHADMLAQKTPRTFGALLDRVRKVTDADIAQW